MLQFLRAEVHSSSCHARLPKSNRVFIRLWRLQHHDFLLFRRTSKLNLRASMILRQAMQRTELSSTVRTLERKKRILPAFLALHFSRAPFHPLHRNRLYVFLKKPFAIKKTKRHGLTKNHLKALNRSNVVGILRDFHRCTL